MLYHNDWTVFTINSSPLIIWLHSYQVSYIGYTSPVCVCLLHVCVVRLDVNRVWTWAFLTYFSKYSRWRLYFQESKRTNFPIFFFNFLVWSSWPEGEMVNGYRFSENVVPLSCRHVYSCAGSALFNIMSQKLWNYMREGKKFWLSVGTLWGVPEAASVVIQDETLHINFHAQHPIGYHVVWSRH